MASGEHDRDRDGRCGRHEAGDPHPGATDPAAYAEPASLLTLPLAHSDLAEAGELLYSGIKFAWRPADASVEGRVEMIRRSVGLLTAASA